MRHLSILTVLILYSTSIFSQVTTPNNVAVMTPQFVGYDGTGLNNKSLDIRNNFNEHINLYTNSIHRIKLNPDVAYDINGYAGDRDGYLLLGNSTVGDNDSLFESGTTGAFSLLHLNGPRSFQSSGYRPWMQTGVTFTDNADLSYMGMRNVSTSATETVVAWANL